MSEQTKGRKKKGNAKADLAAAAAAASAASAQGGYDPATLLCEYTLIDVLFLAAVAAAAPH
jgi:hypothetical protein